MICFDSPRHVDPFFGESRTSNELFRVLFPCLSSAEKKNLRCVRSRWPSGLHAQTPAERLEVCCPHSQGGCYRFSYSRHLSTTFFRTSSCGFVSARTFCIKVSIHQYYQLTRSNEQQHLGSENGRCPQCLRCSISLLICTEGKIAGSNSRTRKHLTSSADTMFKNKFDAQQ